MGVACWLVQPLYVVVELLVAAAASASYSLRDDTISALGQLGCAPGHEGAVVDVCSAAPAVLDAAFVVFGLLRAAGAVLLRPAVAGGGWGTTACALWVASGIAAAAVGLAPVDVVPGLHAGLALPVFVLQPLALVVTGVALGRSGATGPRLARSGLAVGAMTVAGAAAFGARLAGGPWVGALERATLWPAYPWLAGAAWVLMSRRARGASDPGTF
ncbi:hypothetical protein GCM10028802_15940 [Terrabacter terrigena]